MERRVANQTHSRLDRVRDWEARARLCRYSVDCLAQNCDVSRRQLERYFLKHFGQQPHEWLHALRMRHAAELLPECALIKDVAAALGYQDAAHFAHDFKQQHGFAPSRFRA